MVPAAVLGNTNLAHETQVAHDEKATEHGRHAVPRIRRVLVLKETNECHELTVQQREEEKHVRDFRPRRLRTSTRACP